MSGLLKRLVALWLQLFSRNAPAAQSVLVSHTEPLALPGNPAPLPGLPTRAYEKLPANESRLSLGTPERRLKFAPLLTPNFSIAPTPLVTPENLPVADWPTHHVSESEREGNSLNESMLSDHQRVPCEGFVSEVAGVWLYATSTPAFDTAITKLPYAQAVTIRGYHNGFAEVVTQVGAGFIPEDQVTTDARTVWPQFVSGEYYDATATATVLTRRLLNDMFLGDLTKSVLTPAEYVSVRLLKDRQIIPWPPQRPRAAGSWHSLLRGVTGIHVGVVPLSDTIMEWQTDDEVGHLAYVEAVLPDQTLRLSGVGIAAVGEYSEVTIKPSVWREWRPIFISVQM